MVRALPFSKAEITRSNPFFRFLREGTPLSPRRNVSQVSLQTQPSPLASANLSSSEARSWAEISRKRTSSRSSLAEGGGSDLWRLGWEDGGWVGSRELGALLPKDNSQNCPRLRGSQMGRLFPSQNSLSPPPLPQGASREFSFGKSCSHLGWEQGELLRQWEFSLGGELPENSLLPTSLPKEVLPPSLPQGASRRGRGEV